MVIVDTGDNTLPLRRNSVRKLAGNLSTFDVPDADADFKLNRGDDQVKLDTNNFDWDSTDTKFTNFIIASDTWAAYEIVASIPGADASSMATKLLEAYQMALTKINEKDEVQGTAATPDLYLTETTEGEF